MMRQKRGFYYKETPAVFPQAFHDVSKSVSRVLYSAIIFLGRPLPDGSSDLPSEKRRAGAFQALYTQPSAVRVVVRAVTSLTGLAPGGVCTADASPRPR